MLKYDFEFKLKAVKSYLNGEGGYQAISRKYGIPGKAQVERWVKAYKSLGENGLKPKEKNSYYSVQFKLDVIEYMTINKVSAQEVANHFGINNSTLISRWKKEFLSGGADSLCKMKGRPPMNKNEKTKKNKLTREQQLEHENELLRAELAFLKKLKASGLSIPERLKDNVKQK